MCPVHGHADVGGKKNRQGWREWTNSGTNYEEVGNYDINKFIRLRGSDDERISLLRRVGLNSRWPTGKFGAYR